MKTCMIRKAGSVKELRTRRAMDTATIEKTINLTEEQYEGFTNNLLEDQNFIKENIGLMHTDSDGVWHCILVTTENRKDGILVESEGYDYARYAGFYDKEETIKATKEPEDWWTLKEEDIYARISEITKLAFQDDDMMNQDTLFELQEKTMDLLAKMSLTPERQQNMIKIFPWIARIRG